MFSHSARRQFLKRLGLTGAFLTLGDFMSGCAAPPRATQLPAPSAMPTAQSSVAMPFPASFRWGAATSAYQVEGAVAEDGRGPSIWDTFCQTPGAVKNGASGAVACDHYHRYAEDLDLMQALGLQNYRFSIAWPRILPSGSGQVNQKGLDFYKRLVDGLRQRNIEPLATLYHWDLPQPLQDHGGGWLNRDTAQRFAEYADVVVRALGDQVTGWITQNEPWVIAYVGHYWGTHAPGIRDFAKAVQVAHHVLLSHGLAVQALRALDSNKSQVGITLNLSQIYPTPDTQENKAAAQRMDGWFNRWFLDAVLRGSYPDDMRNFYEQKQRVRMDFVQPDDLKIISAPTDFLGVNYYNPQHVAAGHAGDFLEVLWLPAQGATTQPGWEINPTGLYDLLVRIRHDYGDIPVYITENGAAFVDKVDANGHVDDPKRVDFINRHLAALHRAIQDGVNVQRYYAWSLMDNFEWAEGYTMRYGITYVDFDTLKRTPKQSALWYRDVIQQNGLSA